MPAPWYSSADRRFRKREDVVLDSSACDYEDHLLTRRDESDITAVELGALHHELAVDPLRWCADFVAEKHWHSSCTVLRQAHRTEIRKVTEKLALTEVPQAHQNLLVKACQEMRTVYLVSTSRKEFVRREMAWSRMCKIKGSR